MKLDTEFIKLPLAFDVERMRAEVEAIPESDWRPHPQGHPGNSALPLIALNGDPMDDGVAGTMLPTRHLERCPYLQQVLASFQTVFGRSRLMRLEGKSEATLHVDTNYYWADRVRVHVPILTSPVIEFICNEKSLHMAAGEAWIFDAWKLHNVLNPTGDQRIHLVADTVGSAAFWDLVARGERPFSPNGATPEQPRLVNFVEDARIGLETERANYPVVMSPWEQDLLMRSLFEDLAPNGAATEAEQLRGALEAHSRDWRVAWARYGDSREGWPVFKRLIEGANERIAPLEGAVRLTNNTDAVEIVRQMLLRPALNPQLAPAQGANGAQVPAAGGTPARPTPAPQQQAGPRADRTVQRSELAPRFERPIFVVAPPRSGTSLLFETLARSPSVWTVGGESHQVIESLPGLQPANRGWDSNRLTPTDATPAAAEALREAFLKELRDRDGNPPADDQNGLRMLEKTPKNSLRVPFLNSVWPRSLFVYLYRDPRESLSSMISAWESGRFVTYPNLPDWPGPPWSLLLTPEWRALAGRSLPEIVADQWRKATGTLLDDLDRVEPQRVLAVSYSDLVDDPQAVVDRVCEFAQIEFDEDLPDELPLSQYTVSPPEPEKWRRHEADLAPVLADLEELDERARARLRGVPAPESSEQQPEQPVAPGVGAHPLRSVNTGNFADILGELRSSLLITTYQTGRLVCARRTAQGLNTHFRGFEMPMGLAWKAPRLAIGTGSQVWEYLNVPDVAAKLEPAPEPHDGCLIPRRVHYTGDIRIHDVAYAGDELWVVATRFSCLATLDPDHSFIPRWRPPFITELAADDRCHLNGLAVVDDEVRYVTALGATDTAGGWRENKAGGGVLIDVPSSETIISGLSMPHSPRWYRDRLWLLESGQGTLAVADLDAGTVETVVELPGFTRGLTFAGPLAFIGLSEVREATTFGGLPLTGRLEDRQCGVWVVNIETGTVIGFLRFEDLVQEIFDVAILPGLQFPELAEHGSDVVNLSYVVPQAEVAQT
jgi:uncharacterized protein (TIGR03032 family)